MNISKQFAAAMIALPLLAGMSDVPSAHALANTISVDRSRLAEIMKPVVVNPKSANEDARNALYRSELRDSVPFNMIDFIASHYNSCRSDIVSSVSKTVSDSEVLRTTSCLIDRTNEEIERANQAQLRNQSFGNGFAFGFGMGMGMGSGSARRR